ncbi:hypothetical protein LWM68_22120 [Niabella sp. W65]|nr:hypothetical protein [Niabella sp. W65]MCH7365223.1 FGGY family carbohydrate kinase [Niabella sp. W65]ULT46572.1 hypothetical protein KRR40_41025 [Niabella sp. I65]
MLLLGIDVGTSSIKVSVVDGATQQTIAAAQYPDAERDIISLQSGWAEQSPEQWWSDVKEAIKKSINPGNIIQRILELLAFPTRCTDWCY